MLSSEARMDPRPVWSWLSWFRPRPKVSIPVVGFLYSSSAYKPRADEYPRTNLPVSLAFRVPLNFQFHGNISATIGPDARWRLKHPWPNTDAIKTNPAN